MPWFGLGVYLANAGNEVESAVKCALDAGYRSIDTATFYENETSVGKAVRESGLDRKELFITTKVWNSDQGYDNTLRAFKKSLQNLKMDYVDLYLIHWPVKNKFKETWKALEALYVEGKVRAIGVSNFQIHHIKDLLETCNVKPMVNQVEYHPFLTQKPLQTFCREQDIQLEAWSPLMRGGLLDNPVIEKIAQKHNKTPAQVILKWDLQNEVVTIPKSVRPEPIKENATIFDFELSMEDMSEIDSLNENHRIGPDPDNFDF